MRRSKAVMGKRVFFFLTMDNFHRRGENSKQHKKESTIEQQKHNKQKINKKTLQSMDKVHQQLESNKA